MNKAEIRKLISKYQDKQLRELICLLVEKYNGTEGIS